MYIELDILSFFKVNVPDTFRGQPYFCKNLKTIKALR